jgi:hypothetical protein
MYSNESKEKKQQKFSTLWLFGQHQTTPQCFTEIPQQNIQKSQPTTTLKSPNP